MKKFLQNYPLPVIVLSQLFGTSLWFSINGVWNFLAADLHFSSSMLGYLTLMIQAGFIGGTLFLAFTGLPDRINCSYLFGISSFLGAFFNAIFVLFSKQIGTLLFLRFLTGFALAGIYPIGMKLVISWTPTKAGGALSWLLGMLTLGTALPHLIKGATPSLSWVWTLFGSSILAIIGGVLILLLGDGPYLSKKSEKIKLVEGFSGLKVKKFRLIAKGYFGHSWELYAFWMLTPLIVTRIIAPFKFPESYIYWLSFFIISSGMFGCIIGGFLSRRFGSFYIAYISLFLSGTICFLFPLISKLHPFFLIIILFLWGISVIADSPQFSALAAATAPENFVGSSLAIINSIGFSLTIPSIWLTSIMWEKMDVWVVWLLLPGPIYGLISLKKFDLLYNKS